MAGKNEASDSFWEGLLGLVQHWQWWQVSILMVALFAIIYAKGIIRELGSAINQGSLNHKKHLERMKKLENQINATKSDSSTDEGSKKAAKK